jgi:DNA-binding response OmpR family regulator
MRSRSMSTALRKKLESTGVNIITVRGLGYYLEKPAEERKP